MLRWRNNWSGRRRSWFASRLRGCDDVPGFSFLLQFGDELFELFNPSAHLLHCLITLIC